MSPREFERSYLTYENRLIEWLCRNNRFLLMLAGVLVLGLIYYQIALLSDLVARPMIMGTYFIYYTNRFSDFALLALGFVNYFVETFRLQKILLFGCLCLLWIVKCCTAHLQGVDLLPLLLIYSFVPLFCGTLYVLDEHFPKTLAKFQYHYLICYFLYYILFGFALAYFKYDAAVEFLWSFKFQYLLITLLASLYFNSHFSLSAMVLNPINACFGVFWPLNAVLNSNDLNEKTKLWWQGLLNLFLCAFLLLIRYGFESWLQGKPHSWATSFAMYFLVLMAEVAGFNFISGGSRLFGFKVGDATQFLFLAKNPAETWQRGSVYSYQFIQRFIFFPLIRFTQNRFVLVLICFSFFYAVKYGYQPGLNFLIESIGGHPLHIDFPEPFNLYKKCIWFALIYLTRKNWIFIESNIDQRGIRPWLSILATHLVIFALPTLIFKIFLSLRS